MRVTQIYLCTERSMFLVMRYRTQVKKDIFFYIHGSVHRNSVLIRSNKMQKYAGIYLLQNHSTCFRRPSHPSSGVHKSVTAASGTATTFLQRGQIWPRWRKVVAVPEAAVTVLYTPDDGCNGRLKHVE